MKPVVLRTGRPMDALLATRGDFVNWYARTLGWSTDRFAEVDALDGGPYPTASTIDGLIITGSVSSVQDHEPWSVVATQWVEAVMKAGIPILGICYGHQMLGEILGAEIGRNPNGREMGVCVVEQVGQDPLFSGLPQQFPVIQTHRDAVNTCSTDMDIIAKNAQTPIQALRHGDTVRGVQWHPEFDEEIITHYVKQRANAIEAEAGPHEVDKILAGIHPVSTGAIILRNFMSSFLGLGDEAP